MKPSRVVSERIRMLRSQLREKHGGYTQVDLAEYVGNYGLHLDPTQLSRLEAGSRAVRVEDLLALAAALHATPADLLEPPAGETLDLGEWHLGADQARTWVSGRMGWLASLRGPIDVDDLRARSSEQSELNIALEDLQVAVECIEDGDDEGMLSHISGAVWVLSGIVSRRLWQRQGGIDQHPVREGE